ncbi:MAG: hypothetical protein N0C84_01455 [Candidatus Thiodiazotropha taylori]|uniref:Uncharacterized protein n=1 Tax=Candidatus Thiodiazotropha taylori TaxID=2792791 RepID=A0A9E4N3M1_9GAMM|nr:hypothetical protein [Candidatus Thiodiazotropha taylori]MCW4255114.1 hypothetical protein [Candidatus Thiodiazotropha taylori]
MHSFSKQCVGAHQLVKKSSLNAFAKTAFELSKLEENKEIFGTAKDDPSWSPQCFGSAVEFLAENFFEHYGHVFNLVFVRSIDDWNTADKDRGIDHIAQSLKSKRYGSRQSKEGSPVYIQTKGVLDPRHVHMTNDGSRIMNFYGHAQGRAGSEGTYYQSRYVLFTLAKGLHYILEQNTYNMIEVINGTRIKKMIDKDEVFFNKLRSKLDVEEVTTSNPTQDPEFITINS